MVLSVIRADSGVQVGYSHLSLVATVNPSTLNENGRPVSLMVNTSFVESHTCRADELPMMLKAKH